MKGVLTIRVQLTRHAIARWHEYNGKTPIREIQKRVSQCLFNKFKTGIKLCNNDILYIQVGGIEAVVQLTGIGWKVITFHRRGCLKS